MTGTNGRITRIFSATGMVPEKLSPGAFKTPGDEQAGREDYSITAAQPPLRAIFRVAFPVLSTLRCVLR